jgi:hypothetical protein
LGSQMAPSSPSNPAASRHPVAITFGGFRVLKAGCCCRIPQGIKENSDESFREPHAVLLVDASELGPGLAVALDRHGRGAHR